MGKTVISTKVNNVHSDIRGPIFFKALEMEASGKKVLKLNTGNPAAFGFKMPSSVKSVILNDVEKSLGYCGIQGMNPALQAICDYETSKGIKNLTTSDIFITNGVSEAANMLCSAIVDDGDEVLMPTPCYSLWSNSVLVCGGKPVYYICDESNEWNPDIDDIRKKITSKTKAIVLINPNNPTGAIYSDEIQLEIAKIAREHGLIVFSDEIYDRLVYDGRTHTSFGKLASEDITVVTLNGLSKSHCLCGLRCGWIALSGNTKQKEELKKTLVTLASVRLCSNALMQLIIPEALKDTAYTENMVNENGRLYLQRQATERAFKQIEGISCIMNKGAFYIFPKIDTERYNITDTEFAKGLLEEKNILVVAGTGFNYPTPDHFRIVMLPEPEILENAILEMGDFLKKYKK